MAKPTIVLLTIGGNELPCLVAARRLWELFSEVDGVPPVFWPIHSSETTSQSQRVRNALKDKIGAIPENNWNPISVLPHDPRDIYAKVQHRIEKSAGKVRRYHLHYTGATSAMGIHSFEAMAGRPDKEIPYETSYLDSRTHRLVSGGWGTEISRLLPKDDERATWQLSLEKLVTLHGGRLNPPEKWKGLEGLVEAFDAALVVPVGDETSARANRESALMLVVSEFNEWADHQLRQPEVDPARLKGLLKAFDAAFEVDIAAAKAVLDSDQRARVAFEKWVGHKLRLALEEFGEPIPEVVTGQHPCPDGGRSNFQLDVATVLGYQLVLISVTTSPDSGRTKQKAMEAYYHARQIGGDEAYSGTVGWLNEFNASSVESGLRIDLPRRANVEAGLHIDVSQRAPVGLWNMSDLPHLQSKFSDILKNDLKWRSHE